MYCSALSLVGKPLIAAHMDTAMFYDDCAYLPEWPGPPIGDEEGRIIHEALGDKRAILLAHHGQLVAMKTGCEKKRRQSQSSLRRTATRPTSQASGISATSPTPTPLSTASMR
jgi:hypothetical protein